MGFGVLGFGVWGFGVWGLGFRVVPVSRKGLHEAETTHPPVPKLVTGAGHVQTGIHKITKKRNPCEKTERTIARKLQALSDQKIEHCKNSAGN